MEKLILQHSGPLRGSVRASGAKNAALPIMAACLLTEEPVILEGVPRVTDVMTMADILRRLGVRVDHEDSRMRIDPNHYTGSTAPYELVSLMRASICVLGPLVARHHRARVSMPGGCVIGRRPIDLHLKGLCALGASIAVEHGDLVATTAGLHGTTIHLAGASGSSVLATANVMMTATLAQGTTRIEQAACEPEVVDLANFLIALGAKISGHGTSVIEVEGVSELHGASYRVIPDRIEVGTLLMAAAALGGDVTVIGVRPDHVAAVIDTLRQANVQLEVGSVHPSSSGTGGESSLRVRSDGRLNAVEVTTLPFPGFPTDLQAQAMAMMSISRGVSIVTEKIYPERFMHVAELCRMGAQITHEGSSAIVRGVAALSGAPVTASDLRASAALVIAGLAAENTTELRGVEHLDRGYERLEDKLAQLGASIRREQS